MRLVSLVILILSSLVGESIALYTPSGRCDSAPETIPSALFFAAGSKNHRRVQPTSRIYYYGPSDDDMGPEQEKQREIRRRPLMDPPTETAFDFLGPKSIPEKPKIVVLGATGRIGRHVVRQLMEMRDVDMEIVAFVRSFDKATKVLYEDEFMPVVAKRNNNPRGPKLTIVKGNLVPPEELPGFVQEDTEEDRLWKERAESASLYYGNNVEDYDNGLPDVNEALEDSIKDCTTIISCVGSVRRTHLWHDILARPFVRLLKADVSTWCKDGRHPYYVNYASTRKALGYAEREQLRREATVATVAEAEGLKPEEIHVPRIRFIRISDVCVGYSPWDIVPVVANAVHSLVFRYHEMAERLLEESSLIETVVLRPGDLVDEERDANTTSVQVSSTGRVPSPALVGREDVAALAVAAATFVTQNRTNDDHPKSKDSGVRPSEAFHYIFGCRWVGETLDSYPPQGRQRDGHPNPFIAFRRALRTVRSREREKEREERIDNNYGKRSPSSVSSSTDSVVRMAEKLDKRRQRRRRRPKPYGICVTVPTYLLLALFGKLVLISLLQHIPGGKEFALPWLDRARHWMVLGFASLWRRLLVLLPTIGRRKPAFINI